MRKKRNKKKGEGAELIERQRIERKKERTEERQRLAEVVCGACERIKQEKGKQRERRGFGELKQEQRKIKEEAEDLREVKGGQKRGGVQIGFSESETGEVQIGTLKLGFSPPQQSKP